MPFDSDLRQRFQQCVDENADSMYRVAFRLTAAHDLADELVQETFLNAWRSLSTLKDPDKMRSWIFAILRNQYSKLIRRMPGLTSLSPELLSLVASPPEADDPGSMQEALQLAVQQLDDEHKFPLLMVSIQGQSVDEAAESLDLPRGTVLSRLHRGRQKLKTILERQLNASSDLP